ncbi:3-hydroxybutyryl-CoA dehydrogenase [Streptomyces hirsutus]|uniref:3-hydroxybutyryl-CoA dehydrogenase n=1 Tax=Streptomyces hirsutus TaxID=35620 RepID=UPI00365EABB0
MQRIGVIGCGLMGSGIAEVCAVAGLDVVVVETSPAVVAAGRDRIARSLEKARSKGRIKDAEAVLGRIRIVDAVEAVADRDLVIEAIVEDERAKVHLFKTLDTVVTSPHAVLATNTSSLPVMKLATATSRPSHVVGLHFFNPVPVLSLVEFVPTLLTADQVRHRTRDFARHTLGKHVIDSQDRAGFVVNALLIPFILSAVRMVESGFASAEDVDEALVRGCAHPQGPLALADLIGLDTTAAVARSLYEEFKEPLYAPPPLLARMVDAGLLGRKTGRGFHTYA